MASEALYSKVSVEIICGGNFLAIAQLMPVGPGALRCVFLSNLLTSSSSKGVRSGCPLYCMLVCISGSGSVS